MHIDFTNMVRPLWLWSIFVMCIATTCPAETWYLKSGRQVEGSVEERHDDVFVVRDTNGRRVVIASSQVAERVQGQEWGPHVQPLLRILQDRHRRLNDLLESGQMTRERYDREKKKQIDICVLRIREVHPDRSEKQILSKLQSELSKGHVGP